MPFHSLVIPSVLLALASPAPPSTDAQFWIGEWSYHESWPHLSKQFNEVIGYQVQVFSEKGHLRARITNDGHMTLDRILAEVKLDGTSAKFYVLSHYEEQSSINYYKPGDLLFELVQKHGKVLTVWHKMVPAIENKSGHYFTKTGRPNPSLNSDPA